MYRTLIRIDPARSQAPASIPDNNIVICITCHTSSKDRAMFSIPDQALFSSVTLIKLPPVCNYLVCWECHAMLLKIKKFRQTALKAQQMLNNNMRISPLSNLKSNNLVHWLSIAYQPRMEINPLVVKKAKIFPKTFKEEVECETLKPEQQVVNCIEEDPIVISVKTETEVTVKTETEVPEESGTSHVDIVKCEVDRDYSSDDGLSDEETLLQPRKSTVAYIETRHADQKSSGTAESAIEDSQHIAVQPTPKHSTITKPNTMPIRVTSGNPKASKPLAKLSSIYTNKNTKSDDIEHQKGPKLVNNSPLLASFETDMDFNTYEVRTLTKEEVCESRTERLKYARSRVFKYFCEKCIEKFCRQSDYDLHMKKHDKSAGPFSCNICELRFTAQAILDEHKAEHYKIFTCATCKEEFYTSKSVKLHNDWKHQVIDKDCSVCDETFTNKWLYLKHIRTHRKKIECDECHRTVLQTSFKAHMATHADEPWVKCDVCQKECRGYNRMILHKRNAHAPSLENWYCVECNLSFKNKGNYNMHIKKSMKHVPKSELCMCPQCNKPLPTLTDLNRHVVEFHDNKKSFECDICKKVYQTKKGVKLHILSKHLKQKAKITKICEYCGKTFQNKAWLDQHMNSHLKLRPYKCGECGATFSYSGARHTHIRLKHRKNKEKEKEEP